jgi:hypothetical protein
MASLFAIIPGVRSQSHRTHSRLITGGRQPCSSTITLLVQIYGAGFFVLAQALPPVQIPVLPKANKFKWLRCGLVLQIYYVSVMNQLPRAQSLDFPPCTEQCYRGLCIAFEFDLQKSPWPKLLKYIQVCKSCNTIWPLTNCMECISCQLVVLPGTQGFNIEFPTR